MTKYEGIILNSISPSLCALDFLLLVEICGIPLRQCHSGLLQALHVGRNCETCVLFSIWNRQQWELCRCTCRLLPRCSPNYLKKILSERETLRSCVMFVFLENVNMASRSRVTGSLMTELPTSASWAVNPTTFACLMDWLKWASCWGIKVCDYMNSPSDRGRGPVGLALTTFQKKNNNKKKTNFLAC